MQRIVKWWVQISCPVPHDQVVTRDSSMVHQTFFFRFHLSQPLLFCNTHSLFWFIICLHGVFSVTFLPISDNFQKLRKKFLTKYLQGIIENSFSCDFILGLMYHLAFRRWEYAGWRADWCYLDEIPKFPNALVCRKKFLNEKGELIIWSKS